jgi:KUP system potassium uptake protein
VVLLTIQVADDPAVAEEQRYAVTALEDGFYRVVVRFGFMEEPNVVPVLEAAVKEAGIPFSYPDVTYYLGRENFVASRKGHMGAVAETVFMLLQKNAVAADRFFGLPHRHVVEIGTQMDL